MLKKVIIGLGVLLVVLAGTGYFMLEQMRKKSPETQVTAKIGNTEVSVVYGAPSVRNRVIFAQGDDALQPFGEYWRMGANEMTTISFSRDVSFGGNPVPKGVYGIYCIPREEVFEVRLNNMADRWGYTEPDYALDVVSVEAITERSDALTETLTIKPEVVNDSMWLFMSWEYYTWKTSIVPIK
jgi:hypothetical protein